MSKEYRVAVGDIFTVGKSLGLLHLLWLCLLRLVIYQ